MVVENVDDFQTGEVVSNDDPNYGGRLKLRIKGLNDNIPVEQLPWVTFAGSNVFSGGGGGSISIPRVGSQVRIKFKDNDVNSMEWVANNKIDTKLREEIASDYIGTHVLVYDSEANLSVKYQPGSGFVIFFKDSMIQITPDNNITIHYGEPDSGTQIQLSEGQVNITSNQAINISAQNTVNVEAQNVVIDGSDSVQISGDTPGECAVNGKKLMSLLQQLAMQIDTKVPASGPLATSMVNGFKEGIMNQKITYM